MARSVSCQKISPHEWIGCTVRPLGGVKVNLDNFDSSCFKLELLPYFSHFLQTFIPLWIANETGFPLTYKSC